MKKRLLFIINTMGRAGAEKALVELLKKLDSMGKYELSLYTIIPCGELFKELPENIHILNKRIYTCSLLSIRGKLIILCNIMQAFFYRLTGFKQLKYLIGIIKEQKASKRIQYDKLFWRLLAEGRPDLSENYDMAVAYIEGAATYFLAEKVMADKKAAFVHIDYQRAGYTPNMDRGCYGKMDRIYVVSNGVGKVFCSVYPQYGKKVRLFRNILNKDEIKEKAYSGQGFSDDFKGIRLVTVGRLHYQKGYDIAIEAMARIIKDGYNVRWYVIGEGPEKAKLEMRIKKYNLQNHFILMGKKENPYPYINQADIYVHATRYEGKSIAIEEAQILGKVIAASDCTGNCEQIVSGHDGVLFQLKAEYIAKEIEWLIDNPDIRKKYEKNTKEKNLDHPEDIEDLLSMID